MRSTSGEYFIALDHVRVLAVFMVFTWHFIHGANGYPVPFNNAALSPLSLLDEGHTGVALCMTLSGYLFAKLLDGKSMNYAAFLRNRALRLLPLLVVVILIEGIRRLVTGENVGFYAYSIARGIVCPFLPNGGWSITVEFHYYIVLPLLLWMLRNSAWLPMSIIAAAIALRTVIYCEAGEIQRLAFWTLAGRIDQFALGMLLYQVRTSVAHRHALAIAVFAGFTTFYGYFDLQGGFFKNPSYPSSSPIWILLPTIEGMAYATLIAWYDNSFCPAATGVSRFIGRIGEYSYSIFLLHFFVVFHISGFVNERIMDISNIYVACLWSTFMFLLMMPVAYLSFRYIETPFLKQRRRYMMNALVRRHPVRESVWSANASS